MSDPLRPVVPPSDPPPPDDEAEAASAREGAEARPEATNANATNANAPDPDAALDRLRRLVERSAEALEGARAANARLKARLKALEARVADLEADLARRPAPSLPGEALLRLDDDPHALRRQIDTYLAAIDRYLGPEEHERVSNADEAASSAEAHAGEHPAKEADDDAG
jgi:hypothetical protein